MPHLSNQNSILTPAGIPRRAMLGASAVAVPAIVMTATTPALAVSGQTMSVVLTPSSVVAGGTSSVVVTVKSPAGAAVVGQAVTLSSSTGVSFSPATGVTQSDGTFRSTLTVAASHAAGTVTVSAVSDRSNVSASLTVRTVSVEVAVSPASSVRGDSSTVTATVKDSSGAALANRSVSFSTSTSGVSFAAANGTTNSSGQYSTTVRSTTSTAAGDATLTATSGGATGTATWTLLGVSVSVALSPSSITSGDSTTAVATVTASNGAALSGRSVSFSTGYGNVSFSAANGTTNGSGQYSTTVTTNGSTAAGTVTVSASSVSASGSGQFTVSSPSLGISGPSEIAAGTNATISLTGGPGRGVSLSNNGSGIGYPNGASTTFPANGSTGIVVSANNNAVGNITFTASSSGLTRSIDVYVRPAGSSSTGGTLLDVPYFISASKQVATNNRVTSADALLFGLSDTSGRPVPRGQYAILVPSSAPSGFAWYALNVDYTSFNPTFRYVSAGTWLTAGNESNTQVLEHLALRRTDGAAFDPQSVPAGSGSSYISVKSRTGSAFAYTPNAGTWRTASRGGTAGQLQQRTAWV